MMKRETILLVDDSPTQCELLAEALSRHHTRESIHIEQGAEAALAFLEAQLSSGTSSAPKLILLDLKLKNETGLDFLRRLRAHPALSVLPVVILTTSLDPKDIHACYALGANGYVVKPDGFADLVRLAGDLCRYWLTWNRTVDAC